MRTVASSFRLKRTVILLKNVKRNKSFWLVKLINGLTDHFFVEHHMVPPVAGHSLGVRRAMHDKYFTNLKIRFLTRKS